MRSLLHFRTELSSYVVCRRKLITHKKIMAVNSHTEKNEQTTFSNRSWEINKTTADVKHHSSGKTFDIRMGQSYMRVGPVGTNRPRCPQPTWDTPSRWSEPHFSPPRAISPCPSSATTVPVSSSVSAPMSFAAGWTPWLGPGPGSSLAVLRAVDGPTRYQPIGTVPHG